MKLVVLATLLTAPTALLASTTGPEAVVVYHTAFYESGTPPWDDAPIVSSFSRKALQALPKLSGSFMMIGLDCSSLDEAGRLTDCKIRHAPQRSALAKAAKRLRREIRIDPDFARRRSWKIEFVSLQIRAWNSDVPATTGPCWPPSCTFVPAAPPPPPPPERGQ
jgi:hypothetical protein